MGEHEIPEPWNPDRNIEHPAPGWKYEVVYNLSDGSIIALHAYYPPDGEPIVHDGQGLLDITKDPRFTEFIQEVYSSGGRAIDDWKVDLQTLLLEKRTPSQTGQTASVGALPNIDPFTVLLVSLVGAMGLSALVVLRRRG
jgi:hypothetical protein